MSSAFQEEEELEHGDEVAHVCEMSTRHILDRCGYNVRIRQKKHRFLEDMLE